MKEVMHIALKTQVLEVGVRMYTNVSAHIQDSDHSEDPNIPAIAHRLLWPFPAALQLPSLQAELLWL